MITRKVQGVHRLLNILLVIVLVILPIAVQPHSLSSRKGQHDNFASTEKRPPLFIAHRGDKFLIPEHTISAYDVAMLTNVDYVEPDLVLTKDGVLVCHHDITLRDGTDVANHLEFASLMTQNKTLFLDGKNVTIVDDWLISDFTQAQLATLRVYQKKTGWRPQYFNGYYGIPTFQEYMNAVHKDTWRKLQKHNGIDFPVVGIIPELKHPHYHNELFHTEHHMEKVFLGMLKTNGYMDNACNFDGTPIPCSPLVVQCFQVKTINYLSENTNLTLLTLVDTQNLEYLTYEGIKELANKTTFISVWKELLYTGIEKEIAYKNVTYDKDEVEKLGGFVEPHDLVDYIHELGMKVGIYTIYHSEENSLRGCAVKCETGTTKEQELRFYMDMGVDAFFVEGLSESLRIRDRWYFETSSGSKSDAEQKIATKHNLLVTLAVVIISALSC